MPSGETASHLIQFFDTAKDMVDCGSQCPGHCEDDDGHRCGQIDFGDVPAQKIMIRKCKKPKRAGATRKLKLTACGTNECLGRATITFFGDAKMRLSLKRGVVHCLEGVGDPEDIIDFAGIWEDTAVVERKKKAEEDSREAPHERRNRR